MKSRLQHLLILAACAMALSPLLVIHSIAASQPGLARSFLNPSVAMQRGKITEPGVAASRLYEAWRRKSRVAALKVAERETVNKLFSVRWRAMLSKGCQRRDEGGFQCIYYDAKNDLSLAINVSGGASSGYGVESVSFSTEE